MKTLLHACLIGSKVEECMYEGLEQAPEALCALLDGRHIGKPLVRLAS